MNRKVFSLALALAGAFSSVQLSALEPKSLMGVVNFTSCLTESKYGKQEQQNLDNMRKQMSSIMEETEKELKDIASKLQDQEFLDGLSPKAEEEMKMKYQALNEDLARYQNQYYQVLNHANYQIIQKLSVSISKASEKIAKDKNLSYVINKDACFYYKPELEVTALVISEMDKNFELDQKNKKLSDNMEQQEGSLPLEMKEKAK